MNSFYNLPSGFNIITISIIINMRFMKILLIRAKSQKQGLKIQADKVGKLRVT